MSEGRRFVIFIRLLVVVVVLAIMYFYNKKSAKLKKKLNNLTFNDFPLFFENFINNKLQANFVGMYSNEVDCLYFVTRKNYINIEYEVLLKKQASYAKKLLEFAKEQQFKVVKMSYKNKMLDDTNKDAIVYQIKAKLPLQKAPDLIKKLYKTVFKATENTHFLLKF